MSSSHLCLGTVQFGMDYGINNAAGKPASQAVFAMLDRAAEAGIEYIDTASAYGGAEAVLGEYGLSGKDFRVITKLPPLLVETGRTGCLLQLLEESLRRLRLTSVDGCLLHTAADFKDERVRAGLQDCRDRGLTQHIGVSVYEPEEALQAVASGLIDYIQVPYNVFDRRLDANGFFAAARAGGVRVFARSAFLQGLLVMDEAAVPAKVAQAKPYLEEFAAIAADYGFSRHDAAFLFSYCHTGIDSVVFGVDNMAQLAENIELCQRGAGFQACRRELARHFTAVERNIIVPSLWKQNKNVQVLKK